MKHQIIEFAEALFPEAADTVQALELLLISVYAALDDLIFSQEDAEEYPPTTEDDDRELLWDYVY